MQIGSGEDVNDLNYDYDNEQHSTWWKLIDGMVDSGTDNDAAAAWLMWTELETLKELDAKTSNWHDDATDNSTMQAMNRKVQRLRLSWIKDEQI